MENKYGTEIGSAHSTKENEIILYHPDETLTINVRVEDI